MSDIILPADQRMKVELALDDSSCPLDFSILFGNDHPVELEIGVGKGTFLQKAAQAWPERNFIGIDYARKYLKTAVDRIQKRPISNVRIFHTEAQGFLRDAIPANSLSVVHLYFPDPWPKKRHHKRRIFTLPFLEQIQHVLQPGGLFLLATDHDDYWAWMGEILEKQEWLVPSDDRPQPPHGAVGLTNYEIKYRAAGRTIHTAGFRNPG